MAELNLQILLSEYRDSYEPGSELRGQVVITSPDGAWEADSIELVLFWRTSGIGTRDEGVAESLPLCKKDEKIPSHFTRDFEVQIPLHPYSYSGKLIKINWHLGLYVKKGWMSNAETEIDLVVRPAGSDVSTGVIPMAGEQSIFYDDDGSPLAGGPPLMS